MLNRRAVCLGGLVMAAASRVNAAPAGGAAQAIEAIELPQNFGGILAYGRRGRIEHIRCVGPADREERTAMAPDTAIRWGSVSKWITSVAILRLVEQRRLSLDTPISAYLPDFRRDTGGQITLAHLLSNTSGLPDLLSRQIGSEPALRTSTMTPAEATARFAGGDLAFQPGNGWDYAALNWVVVAAIVEKVTGTAFPDVVRKLVMNPLKLERTGFAQAGQPPLARLAPAYGSTIPAERKVSPAPAFVAATGNVAGTVRDAIRAAHGVFQGALLGARSKKALTLIHWPEQEYALGGRIRMINGEPWGWETGKVGGYRTHIAHRLASSETIVIFNNTDMEQSRLGEWATAIATSGRG